MKIREAFQNDCFALTPATGAIRSAFQKGRIAAGRKSDLQQILRQDGWLRTTAVSGGDLADRRRIVHAALVQARRRGIPFLLLSACQPLMGWSPASAKACFFVVPVLQGIGFGIIFPAYNSLYINLAQKNQRATATSTYLTSWDVGIGIGIMSSGIVAEHSSFAMVYFVGAILSTVSMIYFNHIVTPHYRKYRVPLN